MIVDIVRLLYLYSSNNPNFLIYILKNNIMEYGKIYINWFELAYEEPLSVEFIDCFYSKVRWNIISKYYRLDDKILYRYFDKLNWRYICRYQKLSMEFITDNSDLIDYNSLLLNNNYPVNYIKDYIRTREGQKKLIKILRSKHRYKDILYKYLD